MRRLLLVLVALMVGVVMAVPAGAQDNMVMIVVLDYVPVDGSLDLVVYTGAADYTAEVTNCLPPGTYEVRSMVIIDQTLSSRGRFTGMITSKPLPSGTRVTDMTFIDYCVEPNGVGYKQYIGTLAGS